MNKKIPKVFIKQNKKIYNNKEIFYSAKENDYKINDMDEKSIRNEISNIFASKDFVYKKRIYIRTNNKKIYIKDILEIKNL